MRRPAIQRSHGLVCSRVTHGQTVRRERMTGVNKGTYGAGGWAKGTEVVIGLDLSDRVSTWEAVDRHGVRASGKVEMTREAVREAFAGMERALVVMEAGTHTLWVAKVLREIGHDVHTVDARELVRARGMRKTDKRDAERLMSLGWDIVHGKPVARVRERTIEQQGELALVRGRDALVRARGRLISTVRGLVKPLGERVGKHTADSFVRFAREELSPQVLTMAAPLLAAIEKLTAEIDEMEKLVAAMLAQKPDAQLLQQVNGVATVTASVFMVTIGDPQRFARSRDVPAYLGLVPLVSQSGAHDPQMRISKAGDALCRRILVQAANYILGPFGKDCALRRWGLKLAGEGTNPSRKKRAVIAVARKLAVLLHRLWVSGTAYDPMRGLSPEPVPAVA